MSSGGCCSDRRCERGSGRDREFVYLLRVLHGDLLNSLTQSLMVLIGYHGMLLQCHDGGGHCVEIHLSK